MKSEVIMNITIIMIIISRVVIGSGALRHSHGGAQERGDRSEGKRQGERGKAVRDSVCEDNRV